MAADKSYFQAEERTWCWARMLSSYLPSRLSTYSLLFFRLSWAECLLRIFRRIFFKTLSSSLSGRWNTREEKRRWKEERNWERRELDGVVVVVGGAQLGYVVMCVWQRECVKIRERVCVSSSCTLERGNLLGRFTPSLARSFFSSSLSTSSCRECWGLCLACEADGQMDRIFQLKQFTPEKSLEWASS